MFINLFQCVQIRSMYEAMAETVGSMMNIHTGSGRYLEPINFSNEIYLMFNLGPLHLLDSLIKEILREMNKTFIRNVDKNRFFTVESPAITTYRKNELEKSHIPSVIWK